MINLYYLINFFECGHFCIKYLLKKDGIKLQVKYHRQLMSFGLVSRVLKEYYPVVNCYKVSDLRSLKNKKRFISLLKLGKNRFHYVVIEKIDKDYVYYYDPMFCFIRKKKIDKFDKKWSNYCCFCSKK